MFTVLLKPTATNDQFRHSDERKGLEKHRAYQQAAVHHAQMESD